MRKDKYKGKPSKTATVICVLNFVIGVGLIFALFFDLNSYFIWSGWIALTVGVIAAFILLPSMKSHSEYINKVIDREIEAQTKK